MDYKYNQELPKNVEKQLNEYIERIKNIKWFSPQQSFNKDETDKQVNIILKAFGVSASIEYKSLKTPGDWDAARYTAWDAARDAAWGAVWDAARYTARGVAWGAAWYTAWDAARDAAWDAAWYTAQGVAIGAALDAARGAADALALNIDEYKNKYPQGNFINIIPLYEAGLYPVGVVDGKFVVYVPNLEIKEE